MQLTPWRPFQDKDDFFGPYSQLLNARIPAVFGGNGNGENLWAPSADISETKKEFLVKAELPDVEKSDIHVSVDDGVLTISGERKHREEEKDETVHRVESFYGEFRRSFSLPKNVDESRIKADSKNGILRVHIPKTKDAPAEKSKEIKVS